MNRKIIDIKQKKIDQTGDNIFQAKVKRMCAESHTQEHKSPSMKCRAMGPYGSTRVHKGVVSRNRAIAVRKRRPEWTLNHAEKTML